MKQKIYLLITACIVTVAALAAVQAYFIYNTYKLREKEVKTEITQKLLDIETSGKLDSINSRWMKKTGKFIIDYTNGKGKKDDYRKLIKHTSDSLSKVMSEYINKKDFVQGFDVSYSNYVINAIVQKEGDSVCDTIFKGKMLLFSNNTQRSNEIAASQSRWAERTTDIESGVTPYNFVVVTARYYSISDWESEVLYKMSGLLIFSVVLLALVVLLFYYSIRSLIMQKRIADIKTDFINNITHEFQTPLAALDIAVKTLKIKNRELTEDQFYNSLSIIDRQNSRMQKLFGQVTDASVVSSAIDTSRAEELAPADVKQVVDDFALAHPEAAINFTAGKDARMMIDTLHLGTILNNLLDNAVKYGGNDISVSFTNTANNVLLEIKDNGRGIPSADLEAIFEKFYRVDRGNVHDTKGLGLGLFYVKQVVQAYGGTISVTSKEGQGSAIIIKFG